MFANQLMFIQGLQRTTASNAALLMPSIPVFAAGVAQAFGLERPRPLRLLGIACWASPCRSGAPGSCSRPARMTVMTVMTVIAYSLNTWAVARSTPTLVATYTTLQPLAATLLAATLLGERVGLSQVGGGALILAGLLAVSRP